MAKKKVKVKPRDELVHKTQESYFLKVKLKTIGAELLDWPGIFAYYDDCLRSGQVLKANVSVAEVVMFKATFYRKVEEVQEIK